MPRLARVVAPGYPHHLTQRGNRRQPTFFCQDDYQTYLYLMSEWCQSHQVAIWAYCLMPNHVHLIVVPASVDGLRRAIGETHRRYTRRVNFRENWRGHLWQGRFASFILDEAHLIAAARYIELNPVRAGLAASPGDYPWSSAAAHLAGKDDRLVQTAPLLEMVPDWAGFLLQTSGDNLGPQLHRHERTGRPLGDQAFIAKLESMIQRRLARKKPGPKPK